MAYLQVVPLELLRFSFSFLITFQQSDVIDGATFYLPSASLQIADSVTTCHHRVYSGYGQEQQIT